jgi:elongation factor G
MAPTCNIALVGHGGSGKTTLAEALLVAAGVIPKAGSVAAGTTASDYDAEEKERRISISTSLLSFEHGGRSINLLDAPGYPDFVGEAVSAISAVETALITVSAPNGIELQTRKSWQRVVDAGLARALVITKLDGENVTFEELMEALGTTFGAGCVPFTLPVGEGPRLTGVFNVLGDAPPAQGTLGNPERARQELLERALEVDDALLERYLSEGKLSAEEEERVIRMAVRAGVLVPVFVTAAEKGLGAAELLELVTRVAPLATEFPPGRRLQREDGSEVPLPGDGPFLAQVFKVISDPFVGKLCYLRVWAGSAEGSDPLTLVRAGRDGFTLQSVGKASQFLRVRGGEQTPMATTAAGEIVAVAKMEELQVADTLTDGKVKVAFPRLQFPTPMVSLAVTPQSQGDEDRVSSALARLAEEDRTVVVTRDSETHELVITGMSNLHLDIMLGRMKRRFNVSVTTSAPKIPYRETVIGSADAHFRHKKQTGGRGQFAEVDIKLEPTERGKGFEFVDEVFGGAIPNQFIPAVEKGVIETMGRGVLAGYPVVDVRVRLCDGKYHTVDSSEAAFKMAASRAFQEGFQAAKPVLLEPTVTLETTAPPEFMGDIVSDLNSRRGRILGMDSAGSMQVVRAQVPLAEVTAYSSELRSMTGGQGSYTVEAASYEVVPQRLAADIIERTKKERSEER